MARINIEDAWLVDPRRAALAEAVGGDFDIADGAAVRFWRLAQNYTDGVIPVETFEIAKRWREFEAARLATRTDDGVYIRGARDRHEWLNKKRDAGRIGGLSKSPAKLAQLIQYRSIAEADASEAPKHSEASDSDSYSSSVFDTQKKLHTSEVIQQSVAAPSAPSAFDRFWSIYPKKVGKKAAHRAWERAKINGRADEILSAVERQKLSAQWQEEGGRFIPNPATWINQGRWDDELTERPNRALEKGRERQQYVNDVFDAAEQMLEGTRCDR